MADSAVKQQSITITRVFDAPRELVWRAWTVEEHFKRWYGPKDFTCPIARLDVRVGGTHLKCMRTPGGQEHWSTGVYREIVENARLVYTDAMSDADGNVAPPFEGQVNEESLITVAFEEHDGKTTMTLTQTGIPSSEAREGATAGWNQAFDKLAASVRTS